MQEGGCTEIRTGHDEGGDLRARRRRSTDEHCDFLSSCRSQKYGRKRDFPGIEGKTKVTELNFFKNQQRQGFTPIFIFYALAI